MGVRVKFMKSQLAGQEMRQSTVVELLFYGYGITTAQYDIKKTTVKLWTFVRTPAIFNMHNSSRMGLQEIE